MDYGIGHVSNDIGSCRPVYDMYFAFTTTFCDNLLGPINSIWTSLGIAIFFLLPAMVIARCIILQYTKTPMNYCDPYLDDDSSFLRRSVSNYGKEHNKGKRGNKSFDGNIHVPNFKKTCRSFNNFLNQPYLLMFRLWSYKCNRAEIL